MTELPASPDPGAPVAPPPPSPADDAAARKQARTARWTRWAGYIVGIAFTIRAIFFVVDFFHPTMPSCEDSAVRDAISKIYKDKAHSGVKAMGNVQTVSHSDDGAECRAAITLETGDHGTVSYNLSRENRELKVQITKVEEG
jgi:hypothetical protein